MYLCVCVCLVSFLICNPPTPGRRLSALASQTAWDCHYKPGFPFTASHNSFSRLLPSLSGPFCCYRPSPTSMAWQFSETTEENDPCAPASFIPVTPAAQGWHCRVQGQLGMNLHSPNLGSSSFFAWQCFLGVERSLGVFPLSRIKSLGTGSCPKGAISFILVWSRGPLLHVTNLCISFGTDLGCNPL